MKSVIKWLLTIGTAISICWGYTVFISASIPFDQDEVLQHHALACLYYPLNHLNTGSGACNAWNLKLPLLDISLPLRSYQYVGSLQSLFYLPLFLIWKNQLSARLFGVLMIAAQAFLLGRTYRLHPIPLLLVLLLWVPYGYHHLVDIGHLSVQTTVVVLFQLVLLRLAKANNFMKELGLSALLGIILGIGFYLRLSFAFLLPACALQLFLLVLVKSLKQPSYLRSLTWMVYIGGIFVVFWGVLTGLLLLSKDGHGLYYYQMMTTQSSSNQATNINLIWQHFTQRLSSFFLDPASASHICCRITPNSETHRNVYLYSLGIFFLFSTAIANSWRARCWIIINLVSFVITSIMVAASSRSYGAHHVVPGFVFLVAAGAASWGCIKEKWRLASHTVQLTLLAAFLSINVITYRNLTNTPLGGGPYNIKLWNLFEIINERFAKTHVQVTMNWNALYNKSLYGPIEQVVLGCESDRLHDFAWVRSVATKLDRDVLFIVRDLDPNRLNILREIFSSVERVEVPFNVGGWEIWETKLKNVS